MSGSWWCALRLFSFWHFYGIYGQSSLALSGDSMFIFDILIWFGWILAGFIGLLIVSAIIPSWRWAVFGNDVDSVYGDAEWHQRSREKFAAGKWWNGFIFYPWMTRIVWWLRNPAANLFRFVLGRESVSRIWVSDDPNSQVTRQWPRDNGAIFALYDWLPYVAFRTDIIEGYLGWKGSEADRRIVFGAALRKARSK